MFKSKVKVLFDQNKNETLKCCRLLGKINVLKLNVEKVYDRNCNDKLWINLGSIWPIKIT